MHKKCIWQNAALFYDKTLRILVIEGNFFIQATKWNILWKTESYVQNFHEGTIKHTWKMEKEGMNKWKNLPYGWSGSLNIIIF